jgi:hypothetical protein
VQVEVGWSLIQNPLSAGWLPDAGAEAQAPGDLWTFVGGSLGGAPWISPGAVQGPPGPEGPPGPQGPPGSGSEAGPWTAIPLDTGWVLSPGYAAPQWRLLGQGIVQMAGLADRGTDATAGIALNGANPLPPAIRPTGTRYYRPYSPCGAWTRGGVTVSTEGIVQMIAQGAGGSPAGPWPARFVELDGFYPIDVPHRP